MSGTVRAKEALAESREEGSNWHLCFEDVEAVAGYHHNKGSVGMNSAPKAVVLDAALETSFSPIVRILCRFPYVAVKCT